MITRTCESIEISNKKLLTSIISFTTDKNVRSVDVSKNYTTRFDAISLSTS